MSFKGDVAQIPLSNILQALLLNNQEGILTLEAGELKRKIRVLKQGLRILNYDSDSPDLLKTVLLKEKILTESQFQNIFSTWTPGSTYPGDFLIARRILTPESISGRILHQVENIVLELIVTPDLKYEFSANADGTHFELFNPETIGQELILGSNPVLMEALRREDELHRIKETIPSPSEIFVLSDKRGFSSKNVEINPAFLKEVKPLLTGEYSASRITALTTLSSFEVHQTLFQLLKKSLIRPLTLNEKRSLSEKLRKSLRPEDAIDTLRSILLEEPSDNASRLKLVSLLEKSKDSVPELADHYLALSDQLHASDPARSQGYLQRVLELIPGDLRAIEKLFDIYRETGDHRNAMIAARTVASSVRNGDAAADSIALLYKIINFYPQEPLLFHDLADVHLHARDIESAISCLQTVADLYEQKGDIARLKKTYELLARLKPSESKHLRRVSKLQRRSEFSWSTFLKRSTVAAMVSIILAGIGWVGVLEYNARTVFASVSRNVEIQQTAGEFVTAKSLLEDFEKTFPYSTCSKSVKAQLSELNALIKKKREKEQVESLTRRDASEASLIKSKVAFDNNDLMKAEDILSHIDINTLDAPRQNEYKALRGKISGYFERANELLAAAEAAEKEQDYQKSHSIRRDILIKFPYSNAAVSLVFPVRIESMPPAADVLLDGQVVGKTPILLRLPPRKTPVITISKSGYHTFELNKHGDAKPYSVVDSHVAKAMMQKSTLWQYPGEGSIEGFPAILGDNVYFGTRNGKIYCLKQATGELVWAYKIPEGMDFSGGIGVWRNTIYFGSFDGRIYALEAGSGKLVYSPIIATTDQSPIKHAASAPSESGVIAVNCDRKVIAAFSLDTGKPAWSLASNGSQFLGQPQAFQGSLYVVTSRGEIIEVDHETGKVVSRSLLGSEVTNRGKIQGGSCFIGLPGGRIVCHDLPKQKVAWSYDCGEQISSLPTVDGDWVVCITVSGKVHCLTTAGELKWVHAAGESCSADFEGTVIRNCLLLGTEGGTVSCLDLWSGEQLWSYKTLGARDKDRRGILSSGVLSKGKFFIGSEDNYFYCFSLD